MAEMLDIYTEDGGHIGVEERGVVHTKGLWHKTNHCWLVKKPNLLLFQARADHNGELYTTASGHISAGEDILEAMHREVKEELGADVPTEKAVEFLSGKYKADFIKNGKPFCDRALYYMYLMEVENDLMDFDFQEEEVSGVFALPIDKTIQMLKSGEGIISAEGVIKDDNGNRKIVKRDITQDDFVAVGGEDVWGKYRDALEAAKDYLSKENEK